MKTSDSIAELLTALSLFQGKVKNPSNSKTVSGGKFSYKYSPLDEILNLVRPILAEEGLSIMQFPITENGMVGVRTLLGHKSGQYIESESVMLPLEKQSAQGVGSGYTYARRYSLSAMLGIASEDDDDATSIEPPQGQQGQEANVVYNLSDKQIKRLYAIARGVGVDDEQVHKAIKTDYNKDSVNDLTKEEYDHICNRLEKAKK